MEIKKRPLRYYVDRINNREPFTFVRYGNGEWSGMFALATRTGSGSQSLVVPGLRQALEVSIREAPRSEDYILGIQSEKYLTKCALWEPIVTWTSTTVPDLVWYEGDVFHKASMKGELFPLIKSLKSANVVVVGPAYLKSMSKIVRVTDFIQIKSRDCYTQLGQVIKAVSKCDKRSVIAVQAGPMAKVLIHRLHRHLGDTAFLIDFGSLWDPFCGKRTRRYHSRVKGEVLRRNLIGC